MVRNWPKYYFKFVPFGEYTHDILLQLLDDTIYASSITQFNDPFEGRWYDNLIDAQYPGADKELKDTLDRRKVYCLCSNDSEDFPCSSDSILMWSHYANSHTGFCIMFSNLITEAEKDKQEKFSPVRVVYSDSMPEKTGIKNRDKASILSNKYKQWAIENEIRLCFDSQDHYIKIPKHSVLAIFAGCRISTINDCLLYGIAKKLNCKYYHLELSTEDYRFKKLDATD